MQKYKLIIALAALLLIASSLFIPPFFGKADDGSFYNTLVGNGLYNLHETSESMFFPLYGKLETTGEKPFFPITIARIISDRVGRGFQFDIRFMAAFYLPLFFAGLLLIILSVEGRREWLTLAAAALAAFIFSDTGYTAYLNSFYTDALYLSAFLLFSGSAMYMLEKRSANIPCLIMAALGGAVSALSPSHGVYICILAYLLILRLFTLCTGKARKVFCVICAATVLLSGILFAGSSPDYGNSEVKKFNSVFFGAVYNSQSPAEDLRDLGIPEKYASLAGVDYYRAAESVDVKSEEFKSEVLDKISTAKIARFYVTHPKRLFFVFDSAAKNSPFLTQEYIKTRTGDSYRLKLEPKAWSYLRTKIIPPFLMTFLILGGAVLFFAVKNIKKTATINDGAIFLLLSCGVFFVRPVIENGLVSISRSLIMFQACSDILFITIVLWCANLMIERRERLKQLYGVNQ